MNKKRRENSKKSIRTVKRTRPKAHKYNQKLSKNRKKLTQFISQLTSIVEDSSQELKRDFFEEIYFISNKIMILEDYSSRFRKMNLKRGLLKLFFLNHNRIRLLKNFLTVTKYNLIQAKERNMRECKKHFTHNFLGFKVFRKYLKEQKLVQNFDGKVSKNFFKEKNFNLKVKLRNLVAFGDDKRTKTRIEAHEVDIFERQVKKKISFRNDFSGVGRSIIDETISTINRGDHISVTDHSLLEDSNFKFLEEELKDFVQKFHKVKGKK